MGAVMRVARTVTFPSSSRTTTAGASGIDNEFPAAPDCAYTGPVRATSMENVAIRATPVSDPKNSDSVNDDPLELRPGRGWT